MQDLQLHQAEEGYASQKTVSRIGENEENERMGRTSSRSKE